MKRKVKFQEGGAVEGESPRNRQLREMMERSGREGRRVGLAERARQREVANQAARRAAAAERAASQRADAEFTRRVQSGQVDAETMRRMGATELPSGRQDFTTSSEGTTRRGTATGREMVPYREPGVPATQGGRGMMPPGQGGTPRQIPLFPSGTPRIPGPVASVARRFIPGLGALDAVSPTSLEAGAQFEREGLAQARREADAARRDMQTRDVPGNQAAGRPSPDAVARMAEIDAQGRDVPGNRAMSPPPPPRPAPMRRLAAPAREGLTSADLNRLMQGEAPRNEMEREALVNIERRRRELEAGGNFKKGGMVKPKAKPVAKKAGGMIAAKPTAAPKKMMKGGMVAKPKVAAKSKAKPMPFKKGGVIKKGKK